LNPQPLNCQVKCSTNSTNHVSW